MGLELLPFLGVTALVMAVPGPSVLYAVTQRLERGRTAGLVAVLGLETGLLIHVLAACLGLSALIAASPALMTGLRYAGAAYLVVLGVQRLHLDPRRRGRHVPVPASADPAPAAALLATPAVRLWSLFRGGVLVDLLNPKTVLFFLALLPQFVPGGGLTVPVAAVLVAGVVGLGLVFDGGYAAAAGSLQRRGHRLGRWGSVLTGGCFLTLAAAAFLG